MAVFHYVSFRASAHHTEDPDRVKQALRHAVHDDRSEIQETAAEGTHKNRILVLEAQTQSAAAAKALFRDLKADDPEGFARMVEELPRRVDEHANFYVRFDKQAAYLGRMQVATHEDAIFVRAKLKVFGPKRAQTDVPALVDLLREHFDGLR